MDHAPNPRYDSLDAWRGLACVLIVVLHATTGYVATPAFVGRVAAEGGTAADRLLALTDHLWVGVPLFFLISGYCITAAAVAAARKPYSAWRFAARRFRRIYPPLWANVALVAVLGAVLPPALYPGPNAAFDEPLTRPWSLAPEQWLGTLTLTEEWRPHAFGPPRNHLSGHYWTLCYEVQFYAVVGVVLMLARRRLFLALAAVTALVALNVADGDRWVGPPWAEVWRALQHAPEGVFYNGLWLTFACGVGVYYQCHRATLTGAAAIAAAQAVALLWSLGMVRAAGEFTCTVPGHLLVASGGSLALAALYRCDPWLARTPLLAPLRYCGTRCYSLYLTHAPLATLVSWHCLQAGVTSSLGTLLVTVPLVLVASLAASEAFYQLVERRFLNASPGPTADAPLARAGRPRNLTAPPPTRAAA